MEVAIVGAGPAGAVAALNLAPFRQVLLIDHQAVPQPRVGESLPGAARRLLMDMGLWQGFLADGHIPRHAHRGAWGDSAPVERDSLSDPDGHGWHLDRARFERRLRAVAVARGAGLLAPARPVGLEREGDGWRIELEHGEARLEIHSRALIDASGRGSRLLASHGARRTVGDRLVCGWIRAFDANLPPGLTQIEAEAEGWWYAAPLPRGGGLLAFHTDADLPTARIASSPLAMLARARELPMLGPLLGEGAWETAEGGYCAAHGVWLDRPAGEGWVAAGDAALAFDPLSAQGLFNALYTGLAAAETVEQRLNGEAWAYDAYADELARIRQTYQDHLAAWYGVERRWAEQPFWSRRLREEQAAVRP